MNICDFEKTLQIFYFKVTDTNAPNFSCTAKKNKIFQYKQGMTLGFFCLVIEKCKKIQEIARGFLQPKVKKEGGPAIINSLFPTRDSNALQESSQVPLGSPLAQVR